MTNTEMMKAFDLLIESAEYHDDELAVALLTKIKNQLTIHHQPPTVEEVGDDEECLYKERGIWRQGWGQYLRLYGGDVECWAYLPEGDV